MLGKSISDPEVVEEGGYIAGMGLLDVETILQQDKTRRQVSVSFGRLQGIFEGLSGMNLSGYEIHMGRTMGTGSTAVTTLNGREDGAFSGNVYGSYLHGIFDEKGIASRMVEILARQKGLEWDANQSFDYAAFKEKQYNELADNLRVHMDIDYIYSIMRDALV